jgi:hypothetical protein
MGFYPTKSCDFIGVATATTAVNQLVNLTSCLCYPPLNNTHDAAFCSYANRSKSTVKHSKKIEGSNEIRRRRKEANGQLEAASNCSKVSITLVKCSSNTSIRSLFNFRQEVRQKNQYQLTRLPSLFGDTCMVME